MGNSSAKSFPRSASGTAPHFAATTAHYPARFCSLVLCCQRTPVRLNSNGTERPIPSPQVCADAILRLHAFRLASFLRSTKRRVGGGIGLRRRRMILLPFLIFIVFPLISFPGRSTVGRVRIARVRTPCPHVPGPSDSLLPHLVGTSLPHPAVPAANSCQSRSKPQIVSLGCHTRSCLRLRRMPVWVWASRYCPARIIDITPRSFTRRIGSLPKSNGR